MTYHDGVNEEMAGRTGGRAMSILTAEQVGEIEKRAEAVTAGPWHVWNGPEYVAGGMDLCIGSGENWVANMDHRWGPNYQERLDHDDTDCRNEKFDCPICSFNIEATEEEKRNAEFIAHARTDIPNLIATLRDRDAQLAEVCDKYGLPHSASSLERHLVNNHLATVGAKDSLIKVLESQLAAYKAAAPLCEKHQPSGGIRDGCLVCGLIEKDAALSRIDYLCGESNDMECGAYGVLYYDPAIVVKAVQALRVQIAAMQERVLVGDEAGVHLAEMFEKLADDHPEGTVPVGVLREIAANVRRESGGWTVAYVSELKERCERLVPIVEWQATRECCCDMMLRGTSGVCDSCKARAALAAAATKEGGG